MHAVEGRSIIWERGVSQRDGLIQRPVPDESPVPVEFIRGQLSATGRKTRLGSCKRGCEPRMSGFSRQYGPDRSANLCWSIRGLGWRKPGACNIIWAIDGSGDTGERPGFGADRRKGHVLGGPIPPRTTFFRGIMVWSPLVMLQAVPSEMSVRIRPDGL